jgi:ABC-type multidrug transport system ATPase subunit
MLIGINGSGKTTLLKILSTLTKPDSGTIYISDYSISKHNQEIRKLVGIVTHNHMLYEQLSTYENLKFVGKLYGLNNIDKKISELSKLLKLNTVLNKKVRSLSHGFKKRISIARALIHAPSLLLLDEPESNLDHLSKTVLFDIIKQYKESGKTILIASHNIENLVHLTDRVLLISNNKISIDKKIDNSCNPLQINTIYDSLNNEIQ